MLQIDLWKRLAIMGIVALGLLLALPNGFYSRVETHNDAAAAIEAGADPAALQDELALWPDWMPSSLVNLGLDLRGGAHLLAEVQVEDVYAARVEAMWPEVRDLLREERDRVGPIRLQDSENAELRVRLVERPEMAGEAASLVRGLARPVTSLTGAGSTDIDVTSNGADVIIRQGSDRVLIQVPGIGSAAELKALIGTTAQLTFQPVISRSSSADETPGVGNEILPSLNEDGVYYILERTPGGVVSLQPHRSAQVRRLHRRQYRQSLCHRARWRGDQRAGDPEPYPRRVGHNHRQFLRRGKHPTGRPAARRCLARRAGVPRRTHGRPGTRGRQYRGGQDRDGRVLRAGAGLHVPQLWPLRHLRQHRADHQCRADLRPAQPDRRDAHPTRHRRDRAHNRHGGGCQRAGLRTHQGRDEDRKGGRARD